METSCGFIAGFIYCFGMVDRAYPEPPERENMPLASAYGIVYVLGLIPLWHRLNRIRPAAKTAEWAAALKSYGYADPERLAGTVLWLIDGVCVLGFVGAAVWAAAHYRRRPRWAAFPVLWLSETMLLYQNLNALYFFYPSRPKLVNMHNVFWVLFGLMALYALIARPRPAAEPSDAEPEPPFPWGRWVLGSAAAFALVVVLAGRVNGEKTMATANTRWPVWSWSDGPFPGRTPRP
jgi:hypothetical protein